VRTVRLGVLALLAALTVAMLSAAVALAAPLPDPVPRKWEFRFEPGPLRVAVVDTEEAGPQAFYYMTYYVENNTGTDRYFAPRFELATDEGDLLRSGRGVPREAVEQIMGMLRNDLLLDEIRVQGPLLQGDENAREGLVVWPCEDYSIDEVTVFAAGFSGENALVRRPDNGETVLLRKSKMLRHAVPGDLNVGSDDPLARTLERWIMR
jgi:hypothetical protein